MSQQLSSIGEKKSIISDTLFDSSVFDNIVQEFESVPDDINPKIQSRISPLIFAIKGLRKEITQLLQHFITIAAQTQDARKIRDVFEAAVFEYTLREKESNKLFDQILDYDKQQLKQIGQLLRDQRQMQHENNIYQRQVEVKNQRQCGVYKGNPTNFQKLEQFSIDETSVYDWIVDIDFITSIASTGWKVVLSPKFVQQQGDLFAEKNENQPQQMSWEGATVAVTGLYDKGKTFVLNSLTSSNLPSGKKVTTKGISFKHVNVDNGTKLILVDTAGTYSPVKIENEFSIIDKEATETFISDLVFDIADYFLCVVNDFTSLDQRYLDKLSRNLQQSPNKTFREIIVVHNLKEVESTEILEHVWSTQVTQIYANGTLQKTKVAAINPQNKQLSEKHVLWFKTPYTRHVCIVNDDCALGKSLNPWVFSLLRYWLKAVFIPVNRQFSVIDNLLNYSRQKLQAYFRKNIIPQIQNTDDVLVKLIKSESDINSIQIPQGQIDMSGLMIGQQDTFQPATDIIAGDQYIILMDAPGLSKMQQHLLREQNRDQTLEMGNQKKVKENMENSHQHLRYLIFMKESGHFLVSKKEQSRLNMTKIRMINQIYNIINKNKMSDSPHNQLNTKIEFLHQENQQLRNTIDDLQTVIKLNKQSMRAMIEQDVKIPNQQSTIRDNDNSAKALKLVINEQQKEIDYLMQSLEKVQKERDFAQGKALINEEITYAAEKSEKLLISQLESNINDLNQTIQKQSQRIQQLEKITDQKEDLTGVVIKYRDIIHPNSASILLHEEMETFHQLTVKLQLQINYMKSLQVKLVTMLHKLLSDIQNYLLENNVDLEAIHEQVQGEFLKLLELVQNSKFLSIEINTKQQSNGIGSPMNTDIIGSPILSPFPNKAPQIFKSSNLNQTYDGIQDDRKKVVPKLNLNKAFQIQQINAKRSTQQVKMTEDQLQTKMKKLEQEIEDAKKCVHREMLLAKHFEVENETLKRYIRQVEANNDILVKSNMNFQQKWQKIQQSFMFYKTFFVEHKDQFSQLQMLVQSEKEVSEFQYQKVNVFEDIDQMNFNSARLHNKKDTIRKRAINDISLISYNYNMGNDMSSLMDVEKALHRNQSYTQHRGMVTESIVDQSAVDYDLGNACMERCDSGSSNRVGSVKSQWKEQCKREWTYLATQVHQSKSKDIAQHVKGTIPIQKLTNIQK